MEAMIVRLEQRPLVVETGQRHFVPVSPAHAWEAHAGLEIAFHRSGSGTVHFGGGTCERFASGAIEIYAPGLSHRQVMHVPGDDYFIRIAPIPEFMVLEGSSLVLPSPPDSLSEHELSSLTLALDPGVSPRLAQAERNYRATALFLHLLQRASLREHHPLRPRPHPYALAARSYIREHAADLGSLEDVASAIGISSKHLRRVFKDTYGHSLVREVMEVRLALAEDRIRTTRQPLAEIARRCGFQSEGYLCRVFRQLRQVTPGSLRA